MIYRFLTVVSMGAIAFSTMPLTAAQWVRSESSGMLKMVMVDQAQLSSNQRSAFQRYLQTANLPPTKVGSRCQYYGKPQVWCLLLDSNQAQQVYQQLRSQPEFGTMTEIKDVRRLREPNPRTTGI